MIGMIATIVVVVMCLAAIAILAVFSWMLNEENKSLIAENDAIGGQWNRAVQRKDEQIAELEEQLLEAESQARTAKNELLNVSRERDDMRAIGAKLESENELLVRKLASWGKMYSRLQSKACELCEVINADS